jgi:hypothetical protein
MPSSEDVLGYEVPCTSDWGTTAVSESPSPGSAPYLFRPMGTVPCVMFSPWNHINHPIEKSPSMPLIPIRPLPVYAPTVSSIRCDSAPTRSMAAIS